MDSSEYEEGLEKTSKKISTFGDVLKANLASQAIVSGVKKIESAVTEIGKASLEAYGDYEQLAGGAQLMFGEAYNTVAQNAKNAYKTVQMSQNDYLQQVNGFATGLKTALGGNEQAAADLAHKIVVAEADVVAATGNTQEAVQNAFNGIMKSNYTMLDNLQLGITPTKEGFQQLIDKVNEWNTANGKSTSYTIDNLADCQSALVDYIEMQGLAGYASEEAAGTIQGSVASMKAAWSNLATGMADEEADMEQLTQDFVDSVGTAANNIIPRVQQIVKGVGSATVKSISYLRDTNETIDMVITGVDDLGIVTAATGAVLTANFAGQKAKAIATAFTTTAKTISALTAEEGKAAVASATLNGTFTVGEVVVGVLTGKISLATAAQYAWNTAMNANPLGVIIALVSALGIAVSKSRKHVSELADSYVEQADSADECAANLEELKARYEELTNGENNPNKWAARDREEIVALGQAIEQTEAQLQELTEAEAEAARVAAEAAADPVNIFNAATEEYTAAATELFNTFVDTYDGMYDKITGFFEPFEVASVSVTTSVDEMMAAMQSQIDFNTAYTANLQALKQYGLGDLADIFASYGANGAAYAAEIVKAVEEAGGATTEDGKKIIDGFSEINDKVSGSQEDLALTLTTMNGDIDEALTNIVNDYAGMIEGLDKSAEAQNAAIETMQAFIEGMDSESGALYTTMQTIGNQITNYLQRGIGSISIPMSVNYSRYLPGHKDGLAYVPYDNYVARLHEGERVLTKQEAKAYNSGKSGNEQPIKIVVQSVLDGKVIGESVSTYNRRMQRAGGT